MNKEERENLKKIAIKRDTLSQLSKWERAVRDPKVFFNFFIYWFIAKYIKPIKITLKTLWGNKIKFYLPEGNVLISKGFFELNLFNFFLNFIKEGDIVIDIGAHIGSYTKLNSKLVGDSGRVYSFEPTPRTFKTLLENTKNDKNIITNNFALLNEEKEIDFEDYGLKYSYYNGFKRRTNKYVINLKSKKIKIKANTLDSYFKKNKIERCDFIKIDVEGAESLVLKGMNQILDNIKPIISIEVGGGEEWKQNNSDSIDFLSNKNYKLFSINQEGFLISETKKDFYEYDNLILVPEEKINSINYLIINN